MTGNELYRDEYGIVRHDAERSSLELTWLEGTAGMSEDDFRGFLSRFAGLAEAHHPSFVTIDVSQFRYRPQPTFMAWRDANIIPRYNAAGVKKFAFLVPRGKLQGPMSDSTGPAKFPTVYFDDRDKVNAWFAANGVEATTTIV